MNSKFRVAIFASGSGTNAENIFNHFTSHPSIEVVLTLSNNPNAFVLERAKKFNIQTKIFNRIEYTESRLILDWLTEHQITHVVLAGFLWLIPGYLIDAFPNKIINIHPALLPKYGGKGMYGMKVHEAVKQAQEVQTGITIHLVNSNYDEGKIIFQGICPVEKNTSAEEIAQCVHRLEYENYPRVIEQWILEKINPVLESE